MKRAVCLLLVVFCSTLLLAQQSQDTGAGTTQMTGEICRSTCVKTDAGKSSCDASCTDKSGDMVFVDDNGKLWKINNPATVKKDMMGKKVKVNGKTMDEGMFDIQDIALANGPG